MVTRFRFAPTGPPRSGTLVPSTRPSPGVPTSRKSATAPRTRAGSGSAVTRTRSAAAASCATPLVVTARSRVNRTWASNALSTHALRTPQTNSQCANRPCGLSYESNSRNCTRPFHPSRARANVSWASVMGRSARSARRSMRQRTMGVPISPTNHGLAGTWVRISSSKQLTTRPCKSGWSVDLKMGRKFSRCCAIRGLLCLSHVTAMFCGV